MRRLPGVIALAFAAACGREQPRHSETPPPVTAPAPFVAFSRSSLVIDHLGVPIPPPVTVGSTPSDRVLWSDAPHVVSVDREGRLVGHQGGSATIRSAGSSLQVVVRIAGAMKLVPQKLVLRPGATGRLRLIETDSAAELPPGAIEWRTSDPAIATLLGGEVMAGAKSGRARITARYGGQEAEAVVAVGDTNKRSR